MLRQTIQITMIFLITFSVMGNNEYYYQYKDRNHTLKEDLTHLGAIYAISWPVYYLSQPAEFRENGSFKNFRENFGDLVFDNDEPLWNWITHPISGSQLYLYYRANGYSQIDAVKMTTLSSALFEFLVETYTEPASIQDLYQTPVFGSLIGLVLENFSLKLLNSNNRFLRGVGHVLNPYTLFWFYEGKVKLTPDISPKGDKYSLNLTWEFE